MAKAVASGHDSMIKAAGRIVLADLTCAMFDTGQAGKDAEDRNHDLVALASTGAGRIVLAPVRVFDPTALEIAILTSQGGRRGRRRAVESV
jgi:hypothetical protein